MPTWVMITTAIAASPLAVRAICMVVFGLVAIRGVPPARRPEVVRAVGEAWAGFGWRRR